MLLHEGPPKGPRADSYACSLIFGTDLHDSVSRDSMGRWQGFKLRTRSPDMFETFKNNLTSCTGRQNLGAHIPQQRSPEPTKKILRSKVWVSDLRFGLWGVGFIALLPWSSSWWTVVGFVFKALDDLTHVELSGSSRVTTRSSDSSCATNP